MLGRWLYKKRMTVGRKIRRTRAIVYGIFFRKRKIVYESQLNEAARLLEEQLQMPVLRVVGIGRKVLILRTDYGVIAHLTHHKRTGVTRNVTISLNPDFQHCDIWFRAAFVGFNLRFKELPLELTRADELPREL